MRTRSGFVIALALVALGIGSVQAAPPQHVDLSDWDEAVDGPLPRWREGGTPPVDPALPTKPYAVQLRNTQPGEEMPPTSGLVASPPEYDPVDGVLFRYHSSTWPQVVSDCVAALTGDATKDEIAYVVVPNATHQATATTQFTNNGADMSKVQFIVMPSDSIWLRDYGPHFIWQDGALAIADSHYYPTRPRDNFIPTRLAQDELELNAYPMGLYYSGGNFQPGPNRTGYITALINTDNPGFTNEYIEELYDTYQGVDTLHIFPQLPGSVDGTGHIDMWMYLVDEDTVIISEFQAGSNATAIQITDDATTYMEGLGFTVFRVPAWHVGGVHYTYTNAFRVNDRIFIPEYQSGNVNYADDDQDAVDAWEAAAPGVEIIPIDCYSIIPAAGAIHCIVMQVPRYMDAAPSAHVVSPDGGELLVSGTTHDLRWAASDDLGVTDVELRCSTDGGATFPQLIASGEANDGHFDWTVPATVSKQVVVKVTATDADTNQDAAVSESMLTISDASQTVYDFSTGAGVDRWAWGHQTKTWTAGLDGTRYPTSVSTEIETLVPGAYAAIAASDATSGDLDTNRYASPTPSSTRESTHVFEFTIAEDVFAIRDIGITWEGYGDDCLQMELYVWDNVAGNWSDAAGGFNENAYMENYAGNRDVVMDGHIRSAFHRYIDAEGKLTFLLYAERDDQETFHDYVAVTVTHKECQTVVKSGGMGLRLCGGIGGRAPGLGTLALTGAPPNSRVYLFAGTVNNPTQVRGGTLVPFPWLMLSTDFWTDGAGELVLPVSGGSGPPVTLYMQAAVENGARFEFSDALEVELGS